MEEVKLVIECEDHSGENWVQQGRDQMKAKKNVEPQKKFCCYLFFLQKIFMKIKPYSQDDGKETVGNRVQLMVQNFMGSEREKSTDGDVGLEQED